MIPCTDDYIPVDLRTRPFDVTPQEVWKSDGAFGAVSALIMMLLVHYF